ncbi:TPA: hypothetical protein ACHFM1_000002 [Enterobacter hormaechei]
MKCFSLIALVLLANVTAQASTKLDTMTECVGYLSSMPADAGKNFDYYEQQYQRVYDLYREEMKDNGYNDVELGLNFATYWSVYGTSRPLLKMVDLVQSTDTTALQSAAVQMYNNRNCETVLSK